MYPLCIQTARNVQNLHELQLLNYRNYVESVYVGVRPPTSFRHNISLQSIRYRQEAAVYPLVFRHYSVRL